MKKPTLQSLREKAKIKNEENMQKTREKAEKEETRIKEVFNNLLNTCHAKMEAAAENGEFYCEVTVPKIEEPEVFHRLCKALSEFSPSWNGDGRICLSWKYHNQEW